MLKGLKQYVPSKVCLSCDGCCRFAEKDSCWRPLIVEEEKKQASEPHPVEKIFSGKKVGADSCLTAIPFQETFLCVFFNPNHHTCGIYHARPFECQLYPFLLTRSAAKKSVQVHLNCPYVQETREAEGFKDYVSALKGFLRQDDTRAFMDRNPCLFRDYSEFQKELEEVFVIEEGGS